VPFADAITTAIAAACPQQLDHLAREIWQAHGSGALDDASASAALEALQCRRRPCLSHGSQTSQP
jgi:hypothetical protein